MMASNKFDIKMSSLLGDSEWVSPRYIPFGQNHIPLYNVDSCNKLNRLIGYAQYQYVQKGMLILYRGQTDLFNFDLKPSLVRNIFTSNCSGDLDKLIEELDSSIDKILELTELRKILLGPKSHLVQLESIGIQNYVIEGCLQHYGAKTRMIDLVDNHWIALWFSIDFNGSAKQDNCYILLYKADAEEYLGCGTYRSSNQITINLRQAMSSIFLRPSAQHAWVSRCINEHNFDYSDSVVGIIQIPRSLALEMLGFNSLNSPGSNCLLSRRNLFPDATFDEDKGWLSLLKYQSGSDQNMENGLDAILPKGMIDLFPSKNRV